jgi:hypothetical protein
MLQATRGRQGKVASAASQNNSGPGEISPHYTPSYDVVERVEHGLAVPLDDASELRAPGLGAGEACQRFRPGGGRVDILDSEGEFAFVRVVGAALFGAAIDENTRYGAVLHVGGQGPGPFEDRPPP